MCRTRIHTGRLTSSNRVRHLSLSARTERRISVQSSDSSFIDIAFLRPSYVLNLLPPSHTVHSATMCKARSPLRVHQCFASAPVENARYSVYNMSQRQQNVGICARFDFPLTFHMNKVSLQCKGACVASKFELECDTIYQLFVMCEECTRVLESA